MPTLLAVLVIVVDRATKFAAQHFLQFRVPHDVIGHYLRLVLWYNKGAAFGIKLGGEGVHIGLAVAAMCLVGYMIVQTPREDRVSLAAFGLIVGGAIGNLWDRLAYGRVTDFIDAGIGRWRWPTFNVADSSVVIGIGLLILAHFLSTRSDAANATDDAERPSGDEPHEPPECP